MRETMTDYLVGDLYETNYQSNYDEARDVFLTKIEPIKQKFEHLLNEDAICDAPYSTFKMFVCSVEVMNKMANGFQYIDYDNDTIEYDFSQVLAETLLDEYGWSETND